MPGAPVVAGWLVVTLIGLATSSNIGTGFELPFEVSVNINDRIGGPSAGLMFSLAIFDTLPRYNPYLDLNSFARFALGT